MALELVLAALSAFTLSAWLTLRFSRPGSRLYILDHPTQRSLHSQAVPRSGGVAMVLSILAAGAIVCGLRGEYPVGLWWFAGGLLLAAGIGFADDQRSQPVLMRLLIQGAAAALLVMGEFRLEPLEIPGWAVSLPHEASALITGLFVVWMINLYNFMDGMDGFAGGMASIGFGAFALLGMLTGHTLFAGLSLIITFAALGFLCFNFPPARIFMGDVGSYSLGLLAAGFTLWGMRDGLFPFWVPVLIFSPFIVDATVTLIWRTLRGESVLQAHRTHFYQRLVQQGFGHRNTVLGQYALMIACAMSAIVALYQSQLAQCLVLIGWGVVYMVLIIWVERCCLRQAPP
ncbi:MAG: glycosyltransferase family 4 protein [Gammaproteobacteria bacterium]|nr:glycosyltransferase family 4 protein [Gammaproteobacteria bacterium]